MPAKRDQRKIGSAPPMFLAGKGGRSLETLRIVALLVARTNEFLKLLELILASKPDDPISRTNFHR